MSVSSCPFDVIPAEDLWSPNAQDSLHTVNTRVQTTGGICYSAEDMLMNKCRPLLSLFPFFFSDLVLSLFPILFVSPFICPRARNDPCSVSCLSFLVSLFLLCSVSVSVFSLQFTWSHCQRSLTIIYETFSWSACGLLWGDSSLVLTWSG